MQALKKMRLDGKPGASKMLALLKTDALAWTYMQNSKPDKAADEIDTGLALIDEAEHPDLVALAAAWRARMASERKHFDEAHKQLDLARKAAAAAGKDWIHMRVEMISDDVLHHESKAPNVDDADETEKTKAKIRRAEKADAAEKAYREAEHLAERYGGEGEGYQTSPRIAFALLEQERHPDVQEEAVQRFRKLVENSQIATGRLYGQYGTALIAAKNNATREAIDQLEAIHREIYHLGKGNVLLSLAGEPVPQDPQARSVLRRSLRACMSETPYALGVTGRVMPAPRSAPPRPRNDWPRPHGRQPPGRPTSW